jgi:hypothetical protein
MATTIEKIDETTTNLRTAFAGLKNGLDGWAPEHFGRRMTGEELLAVHVAEGMARGEADWQMPAITATRMALGAYLRRRGTGPDVAITERTYRLEGERWRRAEYEIAGTVYRHRSGLDFEERRTSLFA